MAEQIAASAHRALGLVIAKSKSMGSLPYECYSKLYDSLVQSVIDYGACVWGVRDFDCIKAVQHRAIRFFLGVHKKTANAAILGEMGWTPQKVIQQMCICRQFCRYSKMDERRLNLHVIKWALNANCDNWINKVKHLYVNLDLEYLMDFEIPHGKSDVKMLKHKLLIQFEEVWKAELSRIEGRRGIGLNKLRTYRLFKNKYHTEEYVKNRYIRYSERKALAQIRCGSAAIAIETGRFKNGRYLPCDERVCPICTLGVEDEFHVLMMCNFYEDIREELFEYANVNHPYFSDLNDQEKFIFLVSHVDIVQYTAKACRQILVRRKHYVMN